MREFAEKFRVWALPAALAAAAVYASLRWLLPWLLPFLLALAAAALLQPAVGALVRRGVKRPLASGICVLGALAAAGGLLWLLLSRLFAELSDLVRRLPELLAGLSQAVQGWETRLAALPERVPEGLSGLLRGGLDSLRAGLESLPGELAKKLPGLVSAAAGAAPEALLFTVTLLIGLYFTSASYPALLHGAAALLPEQLLARARRARLDLRATLGKWLRAQLLLLLLTFGERTAAFSLLRVRYALLLAAVTAVVDALPVFGTGTVVLPWAAVELLTGNYPLAAGLGVTYAVVTVLRSCIQPKLLGDQLGLHPLASLASIYVGWRAAGVWGMLLLPVAAITAKQLWPGLVRVRRYF